jgi:transposase
LHAWLRARRPAPTERLSGDERSELHRVRRDNAQLQMERDILKEATALFAREST